MVFMGLDFVFGHGPPAEPIEEPDHDALGFVEAGGALVADVGQKTGASRTHAAPLDVFVVFHRNFGAMRWTVASHSPVSLSFTAKRSPAR